MSASSDVTTANRAPPRAAWTRRTVRENLEGYAFIAPWLIGFVLWTLGPFLASLALSFTDYAIVAPPVWVGFREFQTLLADYAWWQSLQVTIIYAIVAVPLHLAVALAMAVLLNQRVPFLGLWRTVYYLPAVISGVAVATMWAWILTPRLGLVDTILSLVGLTGPNWLGDPTWVLPAFILMSLWGVGGGMVILLGGLQSIPDVLYEAATVDGAGVWHRFQHITLPMVSPVLFFNLVVGLIGAFQYFTQAYVLTQGGPGRASLFYNLYLFQNAFQFFKMGYASAMAWVMFVIILVLTLLVIKSSPMWVYYETTLRGKN